MSKLCPPVPKAHALLFVRLLLRISCFSPKINVARPLSPPRPPQQVWLLVTESNSVQSSAQAAATGRKTSRPADPLGLLTNLLRTLRACKRPTPARRPRGAGVGAVRVTFYSLAAARARAPRAPTLPRTTAGEGPGSGAPSARRGTWGLQTPSAPLRFSCW